MSTKGFFLLCCLLLLNFAWSRHVPRFSDLDEDEQHLFRAVYDTPAYHDDYQEDDLQPGKVDLLKDGLWALKAKIKELKAFDKSLAANLLATKLQLKDLLLHHMAPLKTHHHEEPYTYYQKPSYQPSYAPAAAGPAYSAAPAAAPQSYSHDPYYGH